MAKVWGRGSVDQKGGMASMLTAGRLMKELGLGNGPHRAVHRHGNGGRL